MASVPLETWFDHPHKRHRLDDDMTWACEVAAMRLLKKCKKETLIMLCNDFGIPTSGNKEKLAEEAAEQLHYETDDSDDDDQ